MEILRLHSELEAATKRIAELEEFNENLQFIDVHQTKRIAQLEEFLARFIALHGYGNMRPGSEIEWISQMQHDAQQLLGKGRE